MSKPSKRFNIGDPVTHKRLGRGVVVDRWASLPVTDPEGNNVSFGGKCHVADTSNIYDVVFQGERFIRSVNVCWLQPAPLIPLRTRTRVIERAHTPARA
jgi:hypothetical protein